MQNPLNQIRKLFEYDLWANQKILAALKSSSETSERMVEIFSHILGARQLWYQRISRGEYNAQMVWPTLSLDECEPTLEKNQKQWVDNLAELTSEDLSKEIAYTNSRGQTFKSSIHDILMQVVMHGVYHRGQIAILLRHADVKPPATDYIYYVREY